MSGPAAPPLEIRTERLLLPVWSPGEAADIAAGRRRPEWHADYPQADDRDAATLYVPHSAWSPRHVVRGTTVLGSIGCFGPPAPAADDVPEVEVGFGLVAQARGWGFASEALAGLVAALDGVGVRVRAAVRPDNRASLRVLARCGFTGLRGSDEDGRLVMVRPLPVPPGLPVSSAGDS
ncbi:MAG: GNAT family N-acetyltransferase [Nocardioides marinisabuli]|uniref:GNAT family N-acetyltransferase n=1 Tax=Nocardioides marinisabuli TaxID=419476 RepID=UPI00321A52A2